MSLREGLGLLLLLGGVALLPFAWWLSRGWLVVALALVCVGGPLFFTARRARRMAQTDDRSGPLVLGEARGFAGHRAFDESSDD
ncbi:MULTISPECIES: hypothetical protein [unclassified Pseudomonas]|uniref:hypothetical protein n=1 Tax=unclassified Pseudomonas TaxID=196821 RepID=UPI0024478F2E|nr:MULTISPECIES: hypothetical protein [unclassified Pseudomonas]MDG9925482.1 hypothetical protein [Pseudomonas sp. GD04045]MDH0034077.1 hypothetical protein [Pseudomonas sp. GD04019]